MNLEVLQGLYQNDIRIKQIAAGIALPGHKLRVYLDNLRGSSINFIAAGLWGLSDVNHVFILNDKEDAAYFHNDLEQLTKGLEEMRVAVHRVGPQEDGKIPDQMPDHKEDEDDTGDCDDPRAPDRGGKKGPTANAGFFLGRGRSTHEHLSIIGMIFRHKRHDLFCRKKLSLGF
jgi:hypothetical protein